jgi:UDP-N-acetylmuramoyl-L-alanyl-D-glutamate--2,6-diaminopimelate ligase
MAVFTNLSRAHLEAHGSFGNYKQAKSKLFSGLDRGKKKKFFPQKMIGTNFDDAMSGYFLSFPADVKFGVSFNRVKVSDSHKTFYANLIKSGMPIEFTIDNSPFSLNMPGNFNAQNASLAAACANMLGVDLEKSAEALKNFSGVRGRMEEVPNNQGFKIIVDYGCEPESFKASLEASAQLPHGRLIHVFGSTGGHRDKSKRFEFGKTSTQYSDYIIVTNDDVYESDPGEIAGNIELGIKNYELRKPAHEIILDRREAIHRALTIAQTNDLILITGKGSEQFLVLPGNKRIEWDEVSVVREELKRIERNLKN